MAVTDSDAWAERMRVMCLHGMSKDAWKRFSAEGSWYYEIVAPGFKYNLTDVASAIGLVQLRRAEDLWEQRRRVVDAYRETLAAIPGLRLPVERADRQHAWHLFPIRLDLNVWPDRAAFIEGLRLRGIGCSVHYMPLHLQPYYRDTYGLGKGLFPVAEAAWPELVSLPLYPTMSHADVHAIGDAILDLYKK